jgi:hypothetical protein
MPAPPFRKAASGGGEYTRLVFINQHENQFLNKIAELLQCWAIGADMGLYLRSLTKTHARWRKTVVSATLRESQHGAGAWPFDTTKLGIA